MKDLRKEQIIKAFTKGWGALSKEGIWWSGFKGEGKYEEWWYDGGKYIETFYKNGKKNGEYKQWWNDGTRHIKAFYKDARNILKLPFDLLKSLDCGRGFFLSNNYASAA